MNENKDKKNSTNESNPPLKVVPVIKSSDFDPDLASLADYEHLRITEKTEVLKPETIVSFNGAIISEAGDITTISGGSKTGKSAFKNYLLAKAIRKDVLDPIPGIEVKLNIDNKAIIDIDTEQSRYGHQRNYKSKILRRAALQSSPDNLLSYNIRKLSLDEYRPITDGVCAAAKKQFGGIQIIVVDGVADYVDDPNDGAESKRIVRYFLHLAETYGCAVILIIHVNPAPENKKADSKERGHLGSELQRKSQSLLSVVSNKDGISTINAKLLRNAGSADFTAISLKYDKEKGYHVHYEESEATTEAKRVKLVELATRIFGDGKAYEYGEALAIIEKVQGIKERAAKDRFADMNSQGLIMQNSESKWQKNPYAHY